MNLSQLRATLNDPPAAEAFLRQVIAGVVVAAIAILIGYWIGMAQVFPLALCALAALVLVVTTGLRHRAWVLILIGWSISGYTALLRVPFSIRDIMVMLAAAAYVGYRILSRSSRRYPWHPLDWIIGINFVYLLFTMYVNPVGFWFLRSDVIGARPYVNIFLALVAYWVIWRLPDSRKTVSHIPWFIFAGAAFIGLLYLTAYLVPGAESKLRILYAAFDVGAYFTTQMQEQTIQRFLKLSDAGVMLIIVLCAYNTPRLLLKPTRWKLYALALAFFCILASGYRSALLYALAVLIISSWLHRGWREASLATAIGVALLTITIFGQGRFYQLPLSAQRTLAFLPGDWSPQVVLDVTRSSEGRFKWWRDVIKYRLINNWVFGDGFGARAEDVATAAGKEEFYLVTGALHSGPLTAIRNAGIIGLVLLYVFMIAAAIYSVKCVRLCRGSLLFAPSVFVAVQLVWTPVYYTLIFGSYDGHMPQMIFLAGLSRLLTRVAEENRAPEGATAPLRGLHDRATAAASA